MRYSLSQQKEDLDKSVVHYTEAIFLPSVSGAEHSLNIVQIFYYLATALLYRSEDFEQPEDVKYSIEYFQYIRGLGLPLESFDIPIDVLTKLLIQALAVQVLLEAGDGTRNVEEMVVLCRELLTTDISADFPIGAFVYLKRAVNSEFDKGRAVQPLDNAIECLRDAVKAVDVSCQPKSYDVLLALADALRARFMVTHSNNDYDGAMALLERILDPNQPGECPDSIRDRASKHVTLLTFTRSTIFQNPEYSEMAISRLRAELSSSSIGEDLRFVFTQSLLRHTRDRFTQYSLPESLEEVNSCISQVVRLSSSQSLENPAEVLPKSDDVMERYSTAVIQEKIRHLEELLHETPSGTSHHKGYLTQLARYYNTKFSRTNDIPDIEESIKFSRLLLNATYHNDLERWQHLCFLNDTLDLAFERSDVIDYLDQSIILSYDILELEKCAPQHHLVAITILMSSLLRRSRLLGRREDRDEVLRLMPLAIDNHYGQTPERFSISCSWAHVAREMSHPSVLTAYKSAMVLMQKSLSFSPTVSTQHTRLVGMGELCQRMPLDYASYQIDLCQFEEAIETLEQGRALLWSEMRGLRTPIAQLFEEDSPLAKRFAEINQELEAMTISVTPSARAEPEDGVTQGGDWTDPFGRLVIKQRKLLEEREALISQIQGRPELQGFLKAPSFTTLRSAASRGPVILINHCVWRSDILVIFHNSPLCIIPTASDFYDCVNKLRDELVEARKHGLDSVEYQDGLCSVLKGLYELVGEPVIERLQALGVPEQSRIWWCPTSVFCSLPLHAMGPIPSTDTSERYFSDLYISSYTPSLSALIESLKASPQMLDKPSLLLVAQPDDSLPGVEGEIKVIQKLEELVTVTGLVSSEATPSSVVESLRGSQLAHFACHGVLETGKPFEASFKLHGGSRLTLLDMVRSRLPDAEFAFLSCCHAAEITEESLADEALHLTAAMQYCGFRSVVGTMWEMADTDGRDLAKSFYKSLFSGEEAGVPYYERSARALRDATRKLRKKRGISLERWVNFVHYGA